MPILERERGRFGRRRAHSMVYRPHGTPYARAGDGDIQRAMDRAWYNFVAEFGRMPKQELCVAEVIGITAGWDVTVYEIPEETE